MNRLMKILPRGKANRRGTAFVIVLWICLGLTAMALYFGQTMVLEHRIRANVVSGMQATEALDGAQKYILYALSNEMTPGEPVDPELFSVEAIEIGDGKFWVLGRDPQSEENTELVFRLMDESAKLNINTATEEMLEELPKMTPELAGAIVDWRDTDSEISENGAEADAYARREPSMQCKNGPFETPEELRIVIGADYDLLIGEDTNRNGLLDPNENDGDVSEPIDNADGILDFGLLEYLTSFTREPNTDAEGDARINLTDNPGDDLANLLDETFGSGRAGEIMDALGRNTQFNSELEFYIRSGMTPAEFAEVADKLTISDGDFVEGRVNVNSAPAAVLACIPGIGLNGADDLAAWRENKDEELDSIAWVAEVLEEQAAIEAGPYLTTRSYQYAADVVATGQDEQVIRRSLFIFDTTGDEPVAMYRQDRTALGWPLGELEEQGLSSGEGKESMGASVESAGSGVLQP